MEQKAAGRFGLNKTGDLWPELVRLCAAAGGKSGQFQRQFPQDGA